MDFGRMEADESVKEKLHLAQDLTDFAEIHEGKVSGVVSFCTRGRIQNTDTYKSYAVCVCAHGAL